MKPSPTQSVSEPNQRLLYFSNENDPKSAAEATGVSQLVFARGQIVLALKCDNGITIHSIPHPAFRFVFKDVSDRDLVEWRFVLHWLENLLGGKYLTLVDLHDHRRELVLYAAKHFGMDFAISVSQPDEIVRPIEYALLSCCRFVHFKDDDDRDTFRRRYIGPFAECIGPLSEAARFCPRDPQDVDISDGTIRQSVEARQSSTSVLIVSYFAGPCRAVATQRINYWFEELDRLSGGRTTTHLASTIPWAEAPDQYHHIPDYNLASLLDTSGNFSKWAKSALINEQTEAKSYNTLSYYWAFELEQYFSQSAESFDAVVFSGNPFAYFSFANFARRNWSAKVFFDYRDPFAHNPRMAFTPEARRAAEYKERGLYFLSDELITVNSDCARYLVNPDNRDIHIIPNGYDERVVNQNSVHKMDDTSINFVHAGSLYHDRSPRAVIEAISKAEKKTAFHHIGPTEGLDDELANHASVEVYGRKPYEETLAILSAGDCGVVFVSETGFETPTKVYDYIAAGLDILICTHGKNPKWGTLRGARGLRACLLVQQLRRGRI